ncbi:ENO [Mytilus coruscus]|uniref:ENO n=1 Tax=Mytilus coruscus TaxID=42192 RepID=A0A6J8BHM6_MYTCO|nr:ENO [Mytilus coruscus]
MLAKGIMILPTGIKKNSGKNKDSTTGMYRSIKQNRHAGQEFKTPTGMYRFIKQELQSCWKQLAMQEFMILPTGILPTGMYGSIKLAKEHDSTNWYGHAGIHDSTNWSIKQELSHAGNKLAMQEFMILPTGMYRSIKQEFGHAGNKLAMQEFMILLPTGMYGSIKQELQSCHSNNWPCIGL